MRPILTGNPYREWTMVATREPSSPGTWVTLKDVVWCRSMGLPQLWLPR